MFLFQMTKAQLVRRRDRMGIYENSKEAIIVQIDVDFALFPGCLIN